MDKVLLSHGDLEVEIWTLGARLNSVRFAGSENLLESAATREEALGPKKYHGAVVGPVANRIAGGAAILEGTSHDFERNEENKTTLHSGSTGVHSLEWTIVEQTQSTAVLRLNLADGFGGFPGNRTLRAEFSIHNDCLDVVLHGQSDRLTWMNLALHPYWRLAKNGRDGMRLCVDADRYLPVDSGKIPTGEIAAVDDSIFDLRKIGTPSPDIDHNFCLNTPPQATPVVRLEGGLSIAMDVVTTAPGVQIFTGKPFGIAVEPQHWPDAMHHDHFPSIVHPPANIQSTTYRFSKL